MSEARTASVNSLSRAEISAAYMRLFASVERFEYSESFSSEACMLRGNSSFMSFWRTAAIAYLSDAAANSPFFWSSPASPSSFSISTFRSDDFRESSSPRMRCMRM